MELNISDFLTEKHILPEIVATEKKKVIEEMLQLLTEEDALDKKGILKSLWDREELETTGIGEGLALPHARTDDVAKVFILFARSTRGIEYQSLDEKPVHLIFLIGAPTRNATKVLQILARLSRWLNNPTFREALLKAPGKEEILQLIKDKESI